MNAPRAGSSSGRVLPLAVVLALAIAAVPAAYMLSRNPWRAYVPCAPVTDAELRVRRIFSSDAPADERYREVFLYFLHGFMQHRTPELGRVQYCGAGSRNGLAVSGLEGFARTAPLLAAWVHSGRASTLIDPADGRRIDLLDVLKSGILSGVDPRSRDYWGAIGDHDQRLVEAADIARILWLTRAGVWDRLNGEDRLMITRWLEPATRASTPRNNWMLFPIVIGLELADLQAPVRAADLTARAHQEFARYKQFYLESGWFIDGSNVDFYNTWAIAYELYWIHRIDAAFETEFITGALKDSAALTLHLISPAGIPIVGRSVCYRTAVPVPVLAADLVQPSDAARGRALHALDVVWRYFIARGALRDGALTQGYFAADMRFLDRYSGGGSCQWGLRSLTLAYLHDAVDPFWTDSPALLPVEAADYRLDYPKLGWQISGRLQSGEITVEIPANTGERLRPEPYTPLDRFLEAILRRPFRPQNHDVKYASRVYSSAHPFPAEQR